MISINANFDLKEDHKVLFKLGYSMSPLRLLVNVALLVKYINL